MPINVDRFERMAGEVMKVYQDAEATMLKNISAKLYADPYTSRWAEKKYAEMRNVNKSMQAFVGKLHSDRTDLQEEIIRKAYSISGQEFLKDGAQFAELAGIKSVTPNAAKVVNIISDLSNRLDVADRHILRAANDAYANIVGRASALVATGTVTVQDAVKRELEDFSRHGIASFTDAAGRHWDMETYAEMATLTAIERATIEGYTDAMEEFGFDLAEISSHYGACPICEAWEGVIVSVSGETKGYPTLDDAYNAGVFHPRCLHDISTYYEGISRGANRTTPRPVQDQPSFGYAARAQQRSYERMERMWKRRMAVAETPEEERKAYAHAKMYERRIKDLVKQYNLATGDEDYLYLKKYRMGPEIELSPEAEKVKYALPESLRTYKVNIYKYSRDTSKSLTGKANSGIINLSTGGHLPNGTPTKPDPGWQAAHAERYYAEIASRAAFSDARNIAAGTRFTEEQIEDIRQHVFIQKHDFGDGEYHRFYPSYQQSLAWQRLSEGAGTEDDELWLKHELEELTLMHDSGLSITEAHDLADQRYPWWETVKEKVGDDYVGEIQDD